MNNFIGLLRIELGAGPFDSAVTLGQTARRTAFTEFRTWGELADTYGTKFKQNIESLEKSGFYDVRKNIIFDSIDATQLSKIPEKRLPRAAYVRFTNPNIGNQDIKVDIILNDVCVAIDRDTQYLDFRSGCQVFTLDL